MRYTICMQYRGVKVFAWVLFIFSFFHLDLAGSAADTLEQKIHNAIEQDHVVEHLGAAFQQSPCGEFLLAPQQGDLRFGIIIYNIDILPDKAVFSAGMAFRDRRNNQLIGFRADQVVFSYSHGLAGDVKLQLIDSLLLRFGNTVTLHFFSGTDQTWAALDCNGLREFSVTGQAVFNSKKLLPVTEKGEAVSGVPLISQFEFRTKKWTDILLEISIPPFQYTGLKDFVFSVDRAVLDLSETANSAAFQMPDIYKNLGFDAFSEAVWEGFYLEKGTVRFPDYFKNDQGEKPAMEFKNLIIDHYGFTGLIRAKNVLSFSSGNLSGWSISIDETEFGIVMNHLKTAEFSGDLGLPILPDTSALRYVARITEKEHYIFSVAAGENISFPALKAAQVLLDKNSYVKAEINAGRVLLEAELNGKMQIVSEEKEGEVSPEFRFPSLVFRGLHLSNYDPEFGISYIGLVGHSDSSLIAKYPVQFRSLSFSGKSPQYILEADALIHITEYAAAGSRLQIMCRSVTTHGKRRIVFDKTVLGSVEVAFEKSGIAVAGRLDLFRSDPDYGRGFKGAIEFALKEPQIRGSASALFGSTGTLRYWYFDAAMQWSSPGILLFPGININGFAGGAWHRLMPWDGKKKLMHPEYGRTNSGVILVPDINAGLGLKAGAFLNGGSDKTYQAKTVLEMHFHRSGSLIKTLFYGDLEVMPEQAESSLAQMSAAVRSIPASGKAWDMYRSQYKPVSEIGGPFMLELDFKNHTYSANAAVHIKKAAGNTINGIHKEYLAGEMSAFFSREKWYFRIGRPDNPAGVKITAGKMDGITANAYFLAGTELAGPPPAPAEIAHLFGNNEQGAGRNESAIRSGRGVVMGSSFTATARAGGNDKKLSLYASLKARVMNEVTLIKFMPGTVCAGSSAEPGHKGWYSTGNLYAFLQGRLGARAGRFSFDVMTFTGAMKMDFGGPNPYFAEGRTHISFNLGGLLKYSGNMDISLGDICRPEMHTMSDSSIVRKIYPENKARNVDPISELKLEFNVPVQVELSAPDGRRLMFRLRENAITHQGKLIAGKWIFSEDHLICVFKPTEAFAGESECLWTFFIDVAEYNGTDWIPVKAGGNAMEEYHRIEFMTGPEPDRIPLSNIAAAWPFPAQVNCYREQHKSGYIELRIPQNNLFQIPGKKTIIRISSMKGDFSAETVVNYQNGKMVFDMPQNLKPNSIYRLRLISVNATYNPAVATTQFLRINPGPSTDAGFDPVMNSGATGNKSAENLANQQKLLCEYFFRTSEYPRFADKIKDLSITSRTIGNNRSIFIKCTTGKKELFEFSEVRPDPSGNFQVSAGTAADQGHQGFVSSKIYSVIQLKAHGNILKRDTTEWGAIPQRAVQFTQARIAEVTLSQDHIFKGIPVAFYTGEFEITNHFMKVAAKDFADIKNSLAGMYIGNKPGSGKVISQYIQAVKAGYPKNSSGLKSSTVSGFQQAGTMAGPGVSGTAGTFSDKTPGTQNHLLRELAELEFPAICTPCNYPLIFRYPNSGISAKLINVTIK